MMHEIMNQPRHPKQQQGGEFPRHSAEDILAMIQPLEEDPCVCKPEIGGHDECDYCRPHAATTAMARLPAMNWFCGHPVVEQEPEAIGTQCTPMLNTQTRAMMSLEPIVRHRQM